MTPEEAEKQLEQINKLALARDDDARALIKKYREERASSSGAVSKRAYRRLRDIDIEVDAAQRALCGLEGEEAAAFEKYSPRLARLVNHYYNIPAILPGLHLVFYDVETLDDSADAPPLIRAIIDSEYTEEHCQLSLVMPKEKLVLFSRFLLPVKDLPQPLPTHYAPVCRFADLDAHPLGRNIGRDLVAQYEALPEPRDITGIRGYKSGDENSVLVTAQLIEVPKKIRSDNSIKIAKVWRRKTRTTVTYIDYIRTRANLHGIIRVLNVELLDDKYHRKRNNFYDGGVKVVGG